MLSKKRHVTLGIVAAMGGLAMALPASGASPQSTNDGHPQHVDDADQASAERKDGQKDKGAGAMDTHVAYDAATGLIASTLNLVVADAEQQQQLHAGGARARDAHRPGAHRRQLHRAAAAPGQPPVHAPAHCDRVELRHDDLRVGGQRRRQRQPAGRRLGVRQAGQDAQHHEQHPRSGGHGADEPDRSVGSRTTTSSTARTASAASPRRPPTAPTRSSSACSATTSRRR